MKIKILKYRFIAFVIKALGCEELIDYDEYNEVVQSKNRKHIAIPSSVCFKNGPLVEQYAYIKPKRQSIELLCSVKRIWVWQGV